MTGAAVPGPASDPSSDEIGETVLRLAAARGAASSICPSEVARALRPDDWRPLMGRVRKVAVDLARQNRLQVLRKGKPAELDALRGVIRLRIVSD